MMRAKCKNCFNCLRTKNGDMLCRCHQRPTNADGCCYNYNANMTIVAGGFTLIIVLALSIIAGIGVLVCNG